MTKQLEDLLNLAPVDSEDDSEEEIQEVDTEQAKKDVAAYEEANAVIDKIDDALPPVEGLEEHDTEMDSLASKAEGAYDDLMSLGMNVDTKYSGRIFEVAATMLGHAITAKNAKVDKKMKMVDLQLKKEKMDQAKAKTDGKSIDGDGETVDRTELLRQLLDKNADK